MLLKSIQLKNIRSYLDERIEFPLGSTLLSGDVGSGKSTILQSIEFALFGFRRSDLAGSHLLRHGQDYGYVELHFLIDTKDIKIKRSLRRSSSIVQDACTLEINGVKEEYTPTELKARILELVGYPKEALTKNIPIFRYTVYTPQEEMKHIMLDPESRLLILRKIFNIDKYGQIRANTKIMLADLRNTRRFLEEYTKDLDKLLVEKELQANNKRTVGSSLIAAAEAAEIANNRINQITTAMAGKRKEIELLYETRLKLSRKEMELKSRLTRKLQIEKEILRSNEKIKSLALEMGKYNAIEKPNGDGLKINLNKLERERIELASHAAVLNSDVSKMKQILESGKCAVCGQPVHDVKEFQSAIEEKVNLQQTYRDKTASIEAAIKEIKIRLEALESFALQSERKAHLQRSLFEAETGVKEFAPEMSELNSGIDNLNGEIALLSSKMEASVGVDKEYRELESALEIEQRNKLLTEKEKSRLEQQLKDIENRIKSLDEEIEKRKSGKEKLNLLNELSNWMENHFSVLMEVIEKNVMMRIHREFISLFQKWFEILMQDGLSVTLDENFSPVIQQNGYETEYENLSGGEKTAVALAYRLALNKVINDIVETIKTKDALILDEPTDGFSSEQLDRIRDVINELKLRQIIIVSHETKMDTFVDNVIRLHKDDHVSSVIA